MVATIAACYLIGGIPVGLLIARTQGVDIRKVGSGNIGATNVLRALGAKLGLMALALDILKGLLPTLAARHLVGLEGWGLCGAAAATVVGHCFSPYLRFGGGKGVATALGISLALSWQAGLLSFVLAIAIMFVSRYVSLASMVSTIACGFIAWALGSETPIVVAMFGIAALSNFQHRSNLVRLLNGTENKLGHRAKVSPEAETDTPAEQTEE